MEHNYNYDVFISKESHNYDISEKLYDFLTNNGLKVFLSEKNLPQMGKDDFQKALELGLNQSKNLVVICSKHDIGSRWVEDEWMHFLYLRNTENRNTRIFTMLIDESDIHCIPQGIRRFESFSEKEFERLYLYIKNDHIEDSIFIRQKRDEYIKKFTTESFTQIKNSFFNLNAEYFTSTDLGLSKPLLEEFSINDNWGFTPDTFNFEEEYPIVNEDKDYENDDEVDFENNLENSLVTFPILDVIKNNNQFIIVGNPGSGKTTTLKKILLDLCNDKNPIQDIIPIYIPLAKLNTQAEITTIIKDMVGGEWIFHYLHIGKVILLLDGLNEIPNCTHDFVLNELKRTIKKYPHIKMIFTSRIYGFINHFDLPVYKLLNLTSETIRQFIHQKGATEELYRKIESNHDLKDLASSPMMLTIIIEVWKNSKQIPLNRGNLYLRFVNYRLKEESKKRINNIEPRYLIKTLSQLAYKMRERGILYISREEIILILKEIFNESGIPYSEAQFLNEILNQGFLIEEFDETPYSKIGFIHETYLEFFSAHHLAMIYSIEKKWPIQLNDTNWFEIFKMSIELISPQIKDSDKSKASEERINLIDNFCKSMRQDLPYYTDVNVDSVCKIFSSMFDVYPEYKSYMEQYLLFIILNWEREYINKNTPPTPYLIKLFTAFAITSSEPIFKILIFKEEWNKYIITGNQTRTLRNILFNYTINKRLLYDWLDYASLILFGSKYDKLCKISYGLLAHFTNDELKELYNESNSILYLFNMTDTEFIKQNINKHSDSDIAVFSNLILPTKAYSEDIFECITTTIFPKLSLKLKEKILSGYIKHRIDNEYVINYICKFLGNNMMGPIIRKLLKELEDPVLSERIKDKFINLELPVQANNCTYTGEQLKIGDISIKKEDFRKDEDALFYVKKTPSIFTYGIVHHPDYYHPFEIIEDKQNLNALKSLPENKLIKIIKQFSLYGYFPELLNKLGDNIKYYVVYKSAPIFLAYHPEGIIKLPSSCIKESAAYTKGDIILKLKKRKYYKVIKNDCDPSIFGFKYGVVISKPSDDYCYIKVKGETQDYFASSLECSMNLKVGDFVKFYPTINKNEKYKNLPMAVCIQREGSRIKTGIINQIKINEQKQYIILEIIDTETHVFYYSTTFNTSFKKGDMCHYITDMYPDKINKVVLINNL